MTRVIFQGQIGEMRQQRIPMNLLGFGAVGLMVLCSVAVSGGVDYADLVTAWEQTQVTLQQWLPFL